MEGDILMKIQESAENYLETILMLGKAKGNVRSIDIATALSFSKPSVSVAMKNLRENGYILMDKDGFIALPEKDQNILLLLMDAFAAGVEAAQTKDN